MLLIQPDRNTVLTVLGTQKAGMSKRTGLDSLSGGSSTGRQRSLSRMSDERLLLRLKLTCNSSANCALATHRSINRHKKSNVPRGDVRSVAEPLLPAVAHSGNGAVRERLPEAHLELVV